MLLDWYPCNVVNVSLQVGVAVVGVSVPQLRKKVAPGVARGHACKSGNLQRDALVQALNFHDIFIFHLTQ